MSKNKQKKKTLYEQLGGWSGLLEVFTLVLSNPKLKKPVKSNKHVWRRYEKTN